MSIYINFNWFQDLESARRRVEAEMEEPGKKADREPLLGQSKKAGGRLSKNWKQILFPYGKNAFQGAPSFVEFVDEKETAARVEGALMAKLEPGRFFKIYTLYIFPTLLIKKTFSSGTPSPTSLNSQDTKSTGVQNSRENVQGEI